MKSVNLSENFSIFINLLKTTMGCGILKYPTLYYEYGIIPALILTVISAFASYCGIFLYIDLNDKYGLGNTLSTVSLHFAPYLKILADIVVIAKCYMVGVAYLIYIGEQLVFLLKYFMIDLSHKIALGIVLIFISPFIFISKIDKLKYTSTAGLVAILMLVSASYYRLKSNEISHSISYDTGNRSYIKNLCHFVFSFTCHQNIFTLQNSMENYNKRHLKITSGFSFVSAVVIYSIFGWISYIALGNNLKTSYLEAQPEDRLKVAISIFYICLVSLSIPLQTNPCKSYLLNAVNPDFLVKESYFYVRAGFSLFLTLSIYIFAICGINFDKICGFVGGTFSTFMCFIFASVYHFLSFELFKNFLNTVLAVIAMTYGVLSFTAVLLAK